MADLILEIINANDAVGVYAIHDVHLGQVPSLQNAQIKLKESLAIATPITRLALQRVHDLAYLRHHGKLPLELVQLQELQDFGGALFRSVVDVLAVPARRVQYTTPSYFAVRTHQLPVHALLA